MSAQLHGDLIFSTIRPLTAFDETLGLLQSAIKLGLLTPGSRLPAERDLCTQLGVSRSTLRQALTSLTESGYLHATRGRGGGTFVVDHPPRPPRADPATLAAWRDICDERLGIELGVTVLATARANAASLRTLTRLAKRLEKVEDYDRYCQLDRQFHIAIAGLTESRRLTIAATRIQSVVYDLLCVIDDPGDSMEHSEQDHRALLEALSMNDRDAALAVMCSHLGRTVDMLEQRLGGQPV